jgi:hypothetical protein
MGQVTTATRNMDRISAFFCQPSTRTKAHPEMKRPPAFLVFIIASYVAYSVWPILSGSTPKDFGYTALSLTLSLFAVNGSVIACNILAIICAIGAQGALGNAVEAMNSNIYLSAFLIATAVLLARGAHYLLFSRTVHEFQGKQVQ